MQVITPNGGSGGGGSGTVTSVGLAAPGVLTVSSSPITTSGTINLAATNPGAAADRIIFWDESAGDWGWLTVGSGLSIVGTTLSTSGGGTGDVVGPAGATDGRVTGFDGATGKLIKQGTQLLVDLVTGPASAVANRIATFNGTSGKILQDGGSLISDLATAAALTSGLAGKQDLATALTQLAGLGDPGVDAILFWDDSAGSYAYLTPGTNLSIAGTVLNASGGGGVAWGAITGTLTDQADLQTALDAKVTGPAGAITDGRVVVFDGTTGELVKQGTQLATDLVTGPASAVADQIATYNGTTGKIIKDGGKTIASLDTDIAAKIAGPGTVVSGRTVVFNGTTGLVVAQSTRLEADLVAGPASSTSGRMAVWNGAGGKTLQDGTKLEADVVTGPASVTADRVAAFNGTSGKIIAQGTQLVTDLVTGPGSAVTGRIATFNGTTGKIIQDGGSVIADLQTRVPNKQTTASTATLTPTFSNDICEITAQAAALNIANPTGTAIDGLGIAIRIKDNGTARAITYGTQYRAIGVTLPTTTVISKWTYLGMIFNNTDTKWDVVSVGQEA